MQKRTLQFYVYKNNIIEYKFPDFPSFCSEIFGNVPVFFPGYSIPQHSPGFSGFSGRYKHPEGHTLF